MAKLSLIKSAGFGVLFIGVGHTGAHFAKTIFYTVDPELEMAMKDFKINIITESSLLDFHTGFSLAMGILLIGLGTQILMTEHLKNKSILILNMILTGLIATVSMTYFHPIATAAMVLSFLALLIKINKYEN